MKEFCLSEKEINEKINDLKSEEHIFRYYKERKCYCPHCRNIRFAIQTLKDLAGDKLTK